MNDKFQFTWAFAQRKLAEKSTFSVNFYNFLLTCTVFFLISANHSGKKCPINKGYKKILNFQFQPFFLPKISSRIYVYKLIKIHADIIRNIMYVLKFHKSYHPLTKLQLISKSATVASNYIQNVISQFFYDFRVIFADVSKINSRGVLSNIGFTQN